jgi:hypothetical protein
MCRTKEESSQHLFVSCPFTVLIWERVKMSLNLANGWNGVTVIECFQNWSLQNNSIRELAAYICWFIWKDGNKKIFEERPPSANRILFLATGSVSPMHINVSVSSKILQPIFLPEDKALAWFDGASQLNEDLCGAGGIIKISDLVEYRWTLNCISGTNSKAELMGAWASIILAKSLRIQDLHVMGDSLTVINWLNGKGILQVANLEGWKNRICDLIPFFRSITFAHIY